MTTSLDTPERFLKYTTMGLYRYHSLCYSSITMFRKERPIDPISVEYLPGPNEKEIHYKGGIIVTVSPDQEVKAIVYRQGILGRRKVELTSEYPIGIKIEGRRQVSVKGDVGTADVRGGADVAISGDAEYVLTEGRESEVAVGGDAGYVFISRGKRGGSGGSVTVRGDVGYARVSDGGELTVGGEVRRRETLVGGKITSIRRSTPIS
jgi:hypothetical protein